MRLPRHARARDPVPRTALADAEEETVPGTVAGAAETGTTTLLEPGTMPTSTSYTVAFSDNGDDIALCVCTER